MERTIIHVDMDAFFASVEVRDNPSLKGKPLVIGALPTERGVVSTCSYEARKFGVRSAMNIKEAYRRCPHGIFMHGNMSKYKQASDEIHKIMLKYTDVIEFVALDEGYMDVTGSLRIFGGAEAIGKKLKQEIYESVGVTCSVGISYSMMGAKLASEEKKPDGFFVIPDKEALVNLIKDRPVRVIFGIGEKTAEKLNKMGIYTVQNLLDTPKGNLAAFGIAGEEIKKLAQGEDIRTVTPYTDAKSIGREHTFQKDISDRKVIKDTLILLANDVGFSAKRRGVWARTVTLKLKFKDMRSITRSSTADATNSAKSIYKRVSEIYDSLNVSESVRLVGVSISHFQTQQTKPYEQLSLFEDEEKTLEVKEKNDALEDAIYALHKRYGRGILKTGKEMEIMKRLNKSVDNDAENA